MVKANKENASQQVDALKRPVKDEYVNSQQEAAIKNLKAQLGIGQEAVHPKIQEALKNLPPGADPELAKKALMEAMGPQ